MWFAVYNAWWARGSLLSRETVMSCNTSKSVSSLYTNLSRVLTSTASSWKILSSLGGPANISFTITRFITVMYIYNKTTSFVRRIGLSGTAANHITICTIHNILLCTWDFVISMLRVSRFVCFNVKELVSRRRPKSTHWSYHLHQHQTYHNRPSQCKISESPESLTSMSWACSQCGSDLAPASQFYWLLSVG